MPDAEPAQPIVKIVVQIEVGSHRMSATDDPLFLHLEGPCGREFRLGLAKTTSLRKGALDAFVLGDPDDPDTNIENPELNNPRVPALDLAGIHRVALRKGLDPIPNVRGIAELDDRLEITHARVEFHLGGSQESVGYEREGPIWLGLISGLCVDLAPSGS